ncbi:MAG: hypothetical protein HZB53_03890 [Chloroflexi bacterium]|nr:hypothetical protein [Chloroflexota bacterium]
MFAIAFAVISATEWASVAALALLLSGVARLLAGVLVTAFALRVTPGGDVRSALGAGAEAVARPLRRS